MPALPDLCETAFFDLFATMAPDALNGYERIRQKDFDPEADRPAQYILFDAGEPAKRRPQPGVFDVKLRLVIASSAPDDPQGEAHEAAVAALLEHINDVATTKAAMSAGPELLVYNYSLEGQQTNTIATGEWETLIELKVVCQAR